jgi:riboflavin biosynthesis pyrimidine reductase
VQRGEDAASEQWRGHCRERGRSIRDDPPPPDVREGFSDGLGVSDAPRFVSLISQHGPRAIITAQEALADWRIDGDDELRVALNMIASVDGRIAVDGRSAPLGGPADRALFHALRARADAVMAAAGTVRTERYGPIIRDREVREQRERDGLRAQPLAVIVTRRLDLDPTLPLLDDRESRVVILTPAAGDLPHCRAKVDYIRSATLRAGLAELHERHGANLVLCEGGPSLNGSLAAESLIDELFLAISPLLVGDAPGAGALLRGDAPPRPLPLALRMLLAHENELYARYVSSG